MSDILTQKRMDEVVILTLNRPEVHNALNEILIKMLTETLQKLDQDESVHVICLAGSGKHFCAGGDLEWMQRSVDFSKTENIKDAKLLSDLFHTLYSLTKPTIALIQGAAYGGAIGLIACCDIAIANEKAKFSFSEVKLGLAPAIISPYVVRAIGERQAKRYFLTAEIFDGATAKQMGLVHELVSGENLLENTQDIINLLLKNSAHAMKISKQLFQPITTDSHQSMIETLAEIRTSKEAQKRMRGFLKGFFNRGDKS